MPAKATGWKFLRIETVETHSTLLAPNWKATMLVINATSSHLTFTGRYLFSLSFRIETFDMLIAIRSFVQLKRIRIELNFLAISHNLHSVFSFVEMSTLFFLNLQFNEWNFCLIFFVYELLDGVLQQETNGRTQGKWHFEPSNSKSSFPSAWHWTTVDIFRLKQWKHGIFQLWIKIRLKLFDDWILSSYKIDGLLIAYAFDRMISKPFHTRIRRNVDCFTDIDEWYFCCCSLASDHKTAFCSSKTPWPWTDIKKLINHKKIWSKPQKRNLQFSFHTRALQNVCCPYARWVNTLHQMYRFFYCWWAYITSQRTYFHGVKDYY